MYGRITPTVVTLPSKLADELAQDWPNVQIDERDDQANQLRWEVRMPSGRRLVCHLSRTSRAIELDGDVYDAAEFARWVRFFDESYSNDIPLTAGTTVEALAQPYLVPVIRRFRGRRSSPPASARRTRS